MPVLSIHFRARRVVADCHPGDKTVIRLNREMQITGVRQGFIEDVMGPISIVLTLVENAAVMINGPDDLHGRRISYMGKPLHHGHVETLRPSEGLHALMIQAPFGRQQISLLIFFGEQEMLDNAETLPPEAVMTEGAELDPDHMIH